MNDKHSNSEWNYKKRWITREIKDSTDKHRVVVLTGARQTGKSSLLSYEKAFSDWHYITMDDFEVAFQAKENPTSLWVKADKLIIDEVQKVPSIVSAIKMEVDKSQRRFILSGSSNLLLMKQVSESLAGRAIYYYLWPMSLGEELEKKQDFVLALMLAGKMPAPGKALKIDPFKMMIRGMLPPLIWLKDPKDWTRWWEGYVATYLERDLRQISAIDSLPEFRRLMTALALRNGQMVNQSEISREMGLSQPTISRYIGLLETTHLLFRIPAFSRNRGKRLLKAPKLIWVDPGLVSFLSGHYSIESLRKTKFSGQIFESLVFLHLKAICELLVPRPILYCWRTVYGDEVDFVLEQGNTVLPIEIKIGTRISYKDTESIRLFMREYPESKIGMLIYTGESIEYLTENIIGVPFSWVFGGKNTVP